MCDAHHGETSDADLIRRLQGGELAAFDTLFERHRGAVFGYLLGLVGDHGLVEDIVQDVFVAFVKKIEKIDPRRGARAWLLRVARNKSIDLFRKRKPEILTDELPRHGDTWDETPEADPLERLLGREERDRVMQAVRALPTRERDVLLLHYFSDLPFKEVAKILKRPLGTVLWQSRRGIERLRRTGI